MDRLEAITYLLSHGDRSSEWAEAGLLSAVSRIAFDKDRETFEQADLDERLEEAANN